MSKLVKVASGSELSAGEGKVVDADGQSIALFNVDGTYSAIDNTCTHVGGPLGEGALVEDTVTFDEELVQLLEQDRDANPNSPHAALLFSCNGRGTRLFSEPNHDAGTIQEMVGPIRLAGFFAQGELGLAGGKNFIHGVTASVAFFD